MLHRVGVLLLREAHQAYEGPLPDHFEFSISFLPRLQLKYFLRVDRASQ
jgi:hypothetical protein